MKFLSTADALPTLRRSLARRYGGGGHTSAYSGDMPSFRVTMTIGALRPGVLPAAVLPAAAAAAADLTTVEDSALGVVAGSARLIVRFTAEDREVAEQIADHVLAVTRTLAEPHASTLTKRVGGRWIPA